MAASLRNKVCIVTGASSGIGKATALEFVRRGADLVLASRRIEILDELAVDIRREYPESRVLPFQLDVLDPNGIQECVEGSLEEFGRIDVLFNNAGFGSLTWLEYLEIERGIRDQIDVNLTGMILMSRAVVPTMQVQRSGHILNMGSTGGFVAAPTYSVYAATKFGVRGFTEALRRELKAWGIQVTGIFPGGVSTEFGAKAGIARKTGVTTPGWLSLSASDVARSVADAAFTSKKTIVRPRFYWLVIWLNRLVPGLLDFTMDRFFVRKERERDLGEN